MIKICNENACTGCLACLNVCTHNAIEISENTQGFFYPEVKNDKCINCGLCKKTCPVNNELHLFNHISVYAALVKNDNDRAKSTSGGIFFALAQKTVSCGGYVYGAALCDDLVVRHIEAHTSFEIDKLRNSKYVQSDSGYVYRLAKKRLVEGKRVLFSGTPCQITALRNYLGKDYQNLLTIDILCHGVPSPGLFKKYIKSEEKVAGAKMLDIQFRSKKLGWKKLYCTRTFQNHKSADWGDTFVPGFLKNYYLRESCYSCPFANENRTGDITLGDYWGYKESAPEYIEDDDKGISLVIVNTSKGVRAFKEIRKSIIYAKRTLEDAKRGNPVLYRPCDKPNCWSEFWKDAENSDWDGLKQKYFTEQDSLDWMDQKLRIYFDQPFIIRHKKHWIKRRRKDFHRGVKREYERARKALYFISTRRKR